jgi:myosin-7
MLELKIVVRKRVFKNPTEEITDPVEYSMLYSQAVEDVTTKDFYNISQFEAIELAAIKAQVLFGDDDRTSLEKALYVSTN